MRRPFDVLLLLVAVISFGGHAAGEISFLLFFFSKSLTGPPGAFTVAAAGLDFSSSTFTVGEADKVAQIKVVRTSDINERIIATLEVIEGTAVEGFDYKSSPFVNVSIFFFFTFL